MTERVIHLRTPRWWWIGGLTVAVVGIAAGLIWSTPTPAAFGLLGAIVACFPLLARLDAVKLDGSQLSVRQAIRWRGPVDLSNLEALLYRPRADRQPALWLLVQREAGGRFKRRMLPDEQIFDTFPDDPSLRVLKVAAGGSSIYFPELDAELARWVLPSKALVAPAARARLGRRQR